MRSLGHAVTFSAPQKQLQYSVLQQVDGKDLAHVKFYPRTGLREERFYPEADLAHMEFYPRISLSEE
ncbi:hypothetical protein NDU88_003522 [Pleurodeles waltl]|uniref:Uncharacterized protein n=1 Tax=Pleurodeles waltl TaxID=8319 RepID=A0AAV7TPZ9_PLEWA|nr:hypothetical protein NDU88_003522 [Pleurodeles waltl]